LWHRLPTDFFEPSAAEVAEALLGKILCCEDSEGFVAGRIVETEAYLGKDDAACHASRGMTPRNKAMFGSAGRHYLYRIYGMHLCYNVTVSEPDMPSAVLIRALEPLAGVELQKKRRPSQPEYRLASGPGNLCRVMNLNMDYNGQSMAASSLYIAGDGYMPDSIVVTKRIGITQAADLPLRFYISGHPSVSRK